MRSLLRLTAVLALACSAPAADPAPLPPAPEGEFDHTHAAWTALLRERVQGDRVDYRGLAEDREELDLYLAALASVTPDDLASWARDERFAFWINVYNAFCVQLVLDGYPVDSIRDLGGRIFGRVWDLEYVPLADHDPDGDGEPLSLNEIEHEILRVRFEDARLHTAINCASVSCPPLRAEAFRAADLDRQLDEQARAFLADETRNRFDREEGEARVSAVFDWFEEDFARDAGSVANWLARFAPGDDTAWIREAEVEHLDYDWSLNEVERDE